MPEQKYYRLDEFNHDVVSLATRLNKKGFTKIYGIPQGGVPLAMALADRLGIPMINEDELATSATPVVLVVDDIIDSGRTRKRFEDYTFACLHVKNTCPRSILQVGDADDSETWEPVYSCYTEVTDWIVYWWEGSAESSIDDHIIRQLEFIGEDVHREGLQETPARIIKSWDSLYSGYHQDPAVVLKTFVEGACDEMVLLKDIEMYSTCEHHMLPFFGKAHIAYIPNGKVVGISKLARLLEIYTRRLQIQERICDQITAALMEHLKPLGAACIIEAQHLCMMSRGIGKQNSIMTTSSLKGAFIEKPAARSELMGLIR